MHSSGQNWCYYRMWWKHILSKSFMWTFFKLHSLFSNSWNWNGTFFWYFYEKLDLCEMMRAKFTSHLIFDRSGCHRLADNFKIMILTSIQVVWIIKKCNYPIEMFGWTDFFIPSNLIIFIRNPVGSNRYTFKWNIKIMMNKIVHSKKRINTK